MPDTRIAREAFRRGANWVCHRNAAGLAAFCSAGAGGSTISCPAIWGTLVDAVRHTRRGEEATAMGYNEHARQTRPGQALPARTDRHVRAGVPGAPAVVCRRPRTGAASRPGRLFRRRPCDQAGRATPEGHPGHRVGRVVRHRRAARLPLTPPADDVQDRPLHALRRSRAQPLRPARQHRDAVSAACGHGAGPEVGAIHHRGPAAGRATRRPPDHRPGHHPDGGAAHPADHA